MGQDIENLLRNHTAFDACVYTRLQEAIDTLKNRWEDKNIEKFVWGYIGQDLPKLYQSGRKAAFCRDIYTPNNETRKFINIIANLNIQPIFGEYREDKFTVNNHTKYALGRMAFYSGPKRNGRSDIIYRNVIDFDYNNGKKIKDVKTLWGQSLIDFHRELFFIEYPSFNKTVFFDISGWFKKNGGSARKFYKKFLTLFLRNAILFENFQIDKSEFSFTKDIFLPAFFEIWKQSGVKPLIVSIEPTEEEENIFWLSYPLNLLAHVDQKLNIVKKSKYE